MPVWLKIYIFLKMLKCKVLFFFQLQSFSIVLRMIRIDNEAQIRCMISSENKQTIYSRKIRARLNQKRNKSLEFYFDRWPILNTGTISFALEIPKFDKLISFEPILKLWTDLDSHRSDEFVDMWHLQKYWNRYFDQFLRLQFLSKFSKV